MVASSRFTGLVAVAAALLFLGAFGALHGGWYDDEEIVDIPVYETYGNAIESGKLPYRDFRLEYPPAALPVFALPALVSQRGDQAEFRRAFEWTMAACGVLALLAAGLVLAALEASRGRVVAALAAIALFPLLLGSVVLTRFDLWPIALVLAALAALLHERHRLGFGVLGVAVAAKLFPVVLVPLALSLVWHRRGRREALVCLVVLVGVVALAFLPFVALGPDGVGYSLGRQLARPLQIESLGAAFLLTGHHLFGLQLEMRSSHGSQNLVGAGSVVIATLLTAAQLGTLAWIWLRRPHTGAELVRWSAAALVAFVALGKVLSPQFLIWLAPLVPLVAGRRGLRAAGLLTVALVLTQLWFPARYWDLALAFDGLSSALVLARDLALVAVFVVLSRSGPAPARSP
ncbi:MAG: glycosyltransferase 87 family protein [Gaiellaceae bacterium MAG52_C11]|nr:glycosyltransferase 87 family protein [Candidatus Gaiellasilicea maunaloa]